MNWTVVIQTIGFILIVLYLFCGLDDVIWFVVSRIVGLIRHCTTTDDNLSFEKLRNTPPKMLAISIAAWHESGVIGNVIANFINTADYPKSMYHLFVGVYPNDPETIEAVEEVTRVFPNVHMIINCKKGPTTKAQNINHMIRRIKEYEKDNGISFASLTVHDSEDVIHTYELLATNYLIDNHDALQFPVFPIMKMPKFSNFFKQLTTATYADEFAENHYISMVERRNMNAFVPCAGTGFAISMKRIREFGNGDVLPSESLTEDYLLSLSMFKKGISFTYVLNRLPRVMANGKVRKDYITTRSLFPHTFKAAVKQKTRWTYGITMQSISIKDVFTKQKISFAGRYSFYKDLKAKLINLVPILGYSVSFYCILTMIFSDLPPIYTNDSATYYMSMIVFAIMILRQVFRGYALYHVYGMRSVFFGCLLPPLLPIRLIYGNIINLTATIRAFRMKLFGDNSTKKTKAVKQKTEKKKSVSWSKTDHEFLSGDQLRVYRRMLGDTLIVQRYLTAKQFNEALKNDDKENGEPIGAYLIRKGFITEEQMVRALGTVKHVQFINDEVVRKIVSNSVLNNFDRDTLLEYKILPLTYEDDRCVIGICNETKSEDIEKFSSDHGLKTKPMFVMEPVLKEVLLSHPESPAAKPLSSLKLYYEGKISFEQAVIIGNFALLSGKSEREIRRYMGLEYHTHDTDKAAI